MKDTSKESSFWFKHDSNAHDDDRLLQIQDEFEWRGYGMYWRLIEALRDSSEYNLSKSIARLLLRISKDECDVFLNRCIEIGLFLECEENKDKFYSESLMIRVSKINEIHIKRVTSGRKGGKHKANANQNDESALPKHNQNDKNALPKVEPTSSNINKNNNMNINMNENNNTEVMFADANVLVTVPKKFIAPVNFDVVWYYQQKKGLGQLAAEKCAEYFINHYSNKKWKIGKAVMVDWTKAASNALEWDVMKNFIKNPYGTDKKRALTNSEYAAIPDEDKL